MTDSDDFAVLLPFPVPLPSSTGRRRCGRWWTELLVWRFAPFRHVLASVWRPAWEQAP